MEENIEKNIGALEEEKEDYLEEHPEENIEVEEIEFSLSEEDVDEWISELTRLKEDKGNIVLNIDEETDLKINFDEGEK